MDKGENSKNMELVKQIGMNPEKPDSFQLVNEPLMNNLLLWSNENIDLDDVVQNLFGIKVTTKLIAILLDLDLNSWIGVGGSWQQNSQSGQVRIDAKLTESLLNNAFGPSHINKPFNIKKINPLELNILQKFLGNIETKMKEHWEIDPKYPISGDLIYLVWLVLSDNSEIGRIAFGVPASFRPKISQKSEGGSLIDVNKLANTGIKVPISLHVGRTKMPVNDVKSFEIGDLVLFEDSDIRRLKWHLGEISLVLPEEDHPIFLKEVPNIQELANEMIRTTTNKTNDDPFSSLPLELSAEFQKVFIPLKEVLELKSGGVLPLGSVLDSELILTAQGKPVAKGELVIIGNQFGMRITDILLGSGATEKKDLTTSQESNDEPGIIFEEKKTKSSQQPTKKITFQDELQDLEES